MDHERDDYSTPPHLTFEALLAEASSWQEKPKVPHDKKSPPPPPPPPPLPMFVVPKPTPPHSAEFETMVVRGIVCSPLVKFSDRGKKNHIRIPGVEEKNAVLRIKLKHWNWNNDLLPKVDYYIRAFEKLAETNPDAYVEYQAAEVLDALKAKTYTVYSASADAMSLR